ncbi:MAG: class I SAM-dependent methyltransferase [Aulosira sp. ZfuVER01]|nr:class I SAM-dependent methyltransferase [Aulosira sp. ZfuVER01]MDZ8001328.1 class I SAM-dependent methyltransferase [Aulosira sp. DedVER01a]MDZ8050985.1 class I SAM-dependent methyltransferase [Aulosira sp. ZfuCHP01]
MSLTESSYVFANSQHLREIERLQTIETVFDPASRRRILATGLTTDWRCLEVGAGAGSIMRWMADIVGKNGSVVAVDLDTQFLKDPLPSNVEVLKEDIRHLALENQSFDLIHARFVLIHIPDFRVALSQMLSLLKPGGWIVLEEPDFAAARAIVGNSETLQSVNRVNQAILRMFTNKGLDYALGVKLPAILQRLGLQNLSVENDTPLANGGFGIATVMKMSAIQLVEKYIATGQATDHDIEQYCQFADDPSTWAIYHATVGVVAQQGAIE